MNDGSLKIYGSDGHLADVDGIIDLINEEKCPTLKWKPKLLFFNFCRGEFFARDMEKNISQGMNEENSSDSESDDDASEAAASDNVRAYKPSKLKPILRDILVEWRSANQGNMRELIVGTV
ncbi:hypothetical protein B4U80_12313 [Leptotrombidium deliense]|uniref:Caspase family p20 domain-containing protein n=1 Tax=Leptotrombidium deliense TaxID=299467 RepID=A0A443RWA9_9ACAR|nr:hypothetical protein B4U80_12313 [Leptotrombidium deliense]